MSGIDETAIEGIGQRAVRVYVFYNNAAQLGTIKHFQHFVQALRLLFFATLRVPANARFPGQGCTKS